MNLKQQLLQNQKKIAVWGVGYVGYSTLAHFGTKGVRGLGVEINAERVATVNRGEVPVFQMEYWLGFDTRTLVQSGAFRATTDWREAIHPDYAVHFLGIHTELDGKPFFGLLEDVFQKLAHFKTLETDQPPLVIIESTLTPRTIDRVVLPLLDREGVQAGKDLLVGCAPRRDWFISPEKTLANLPRVFGGTNPETTDLMAEVLGIVCNDLRRASDHRHAEAVKSVENAYRHMEITLANQLALAYPDMDVHEILQLAGTKWNVGTFHPGFGTGGYCIPLSSQYVLDGALNPNALSLLSETLETDWKMPEIIADSLVKRGARSVGLLGLAYKDNTKAHILSPSIRIAQVLARKKVSVKINDPNYTREEIARITGVPSFDFPSDLGEFDSLLVVAGHRQYLFYAMNQIIAKLKECRRIIDSAGIWAGIDFRSHGICYFRPGEPGWLTE